MRLGVSCFFLTRQCETFAGNKGRVEKSIITIQRSDFALFSDREKLGVLRWREANCVGVRSRESKAYQFLRRAVTSRFCEKQVGQYSLLDVESGSGAVALMVKLVLCRPGLVRGAPLSAIIMLNGFQRV